jgi:hypothetical protein
MSWKEQPPRSEEVAAASAFSALTGLLCFPLDGTSRLQGEPDYAIARARRGLVAAVRAPKCVGTLEVTQAVVPAGASGPDALADVAEAEVAKNLHKLHPTRRTRPDVSSATSGSGCRSMSLTRCPGSCSCRSPAPSGSRLRPLAGRSAGKGAEDGSWCARNHAT